MADDATQLRKGVLELAILSLLTSGPMYGVQIISALGGEPGLAAKPGTVYPLLARLAKNGAVASSWAASPSGPARKYYELTAKGRKSLEAQTIAWRNMASAIEKMLGGNHA